MNLSESPILRLVTLCALYVAQGIPSGFVTITLMAYLAGKDLSVRQIGGLTAMRPAWLTDPAGWAVRDESRTLSGANVSVFSTVATKVGLRLL
jgi:hypothetical protein